MKEYIVCLQKENIDSIKQEIVCANSKYQISDPH